LAFTFTAPALAADKLRIGYGAPSLAMSVLWITKEGKLFEKNGLDVEVLYLESALVQRALIAGNIDYGEMTGSLMAAPKLQGADLVMIAGFKSAYIPPRHATRNQSNS
jgi:ABC-type nitrate/sulfonate/bicarbonate transport system substrate-binding protein